MLFRIKQPSITHAGKIPHRLLDKNPDGTWRLQHPFECECFLLHSVSHAPHVSYNMGTGILFCDHCKTEELVPCPARRDTIFSKEAYMFPEAIASDLYRFQLDHEDCKATEKANVASEEIAN